MITQKELKEILHYNPETGVFIRLTRPSNSVKIGDAAGSLSRKGYLRIGVKGDRYFSHRLAWLYVYGVWPKNQIDHINHIRTDNRIINLREATSSENQRNASLRKKNTSGFNGVNWHKASEKWYSRIHVNGNRIFLGCYKTKAAAIKRRQFANTLYGYHENHGV